MRARASGRTYGPGARLTGVAAAAAESGSAVGPCVVSAARLVLATAAPSASASWRNRQQAKLEVTPPPPILVVCELICNHRARNSCQSP